LPAFVAAMLPVSVRAQLTAERVVKGCISVAGAQAKVTAEGHLVLRHMAGPPNFASIKQGDEDRLTLILVLPRAACIDDGGDFADPKARFTTIHVWTLDDAVHRELRRLVGRRVKIRGNGYARENGLHFAPLVLEATSVTASR
jgi:hypothetical protein